MIYNENCTRIKITITTQGGGDMTTYLDMKMACSHLYPIESRMPSRLFSKIKRLLFKNTKFTQLRA